MVRNFLIQEKLFNIKVRPSFSSTISSILRHAVCWVVCGKVRKGINSHMDSITSDIIQALARLRFDFVRVRKNFSKPSGAELPGEVAQKKLVVPLSQK